MTKKKTSTKNMIMFGFLVVILYQGATTANHFIFVIPLLILWIISFIAFWAFYCLDDEEVKDDETEEPWHYRRTCDKCGFTAANYLHCKHDGYPSRCSRCKEKLEHSVFDEECNCEFSN